VPPRKGWPPSVPSLGRGPVAPITVKGRLRQHSALIDAETWIAVRDQLAANAGNHRRKARAVEPSLLAGLLVDARGERLTPSHAVKKDRRYRYYVSAVPIAEAGADRPHFWRIPAREIEDAVISIIANALSSPARVLDCFANGATPRANYSLAPAGLSRGLAARLSNARWSYETSSRR
jgi:site-specific DNA recombinase